MKGIKDYLDGDFYQNLLSNISIGIYFVDKNRTITFFNHEAEKITGYTASEVIGTSCKHNLFNHMDQSGNLLCLLGCPLHATMMDGKNRCADVFLHHKDGHRVPIRVSSSQILDDNGNVIGAVETFYDISHEYQMDKENEDLKVLALEDELTQLPNRRYLEEWIIAKHREFKKFKRRYGVLLVDIDNFKYINDTYGHLVGDDMLKVVADTLKGATRANDIAARYGGEEFMLVLSGIDVDKLQSIGKRVCALVYHSTLEVGSKELSVSVSIGGTIVKDSDDIKDVVSRADELLYKSKINGKNRINSDIGESVIGPELNTGREKYIIK